MNLHPILQQLQSFQSPDGSFIGLSSIDPLDFTQALPRHTIFPTALILNALSSLPPSSTLKSISKPAVIYLCKQASSQWSFNYWARNAHQENRQFPYPDDLDDTFVSLSALHHFQPKLFTGKTLATITSILTTQEVDEGGPYYTWLVTQEKANQPWLDIDLAVNNNIASFLNLEDVKLPSLIALTKHALKTGNLTSPYYPSVYPVIYFITRWYQGPFRQKLIRMLLEMQQDGYWENPLNTALVISSLIRLGHPTSQLIRSIDNLKLYISNQKPSPFAFCLDPALHGKTYYSGSSALTLAFITEALHLATSQFQPTSIPSSHSDDVINTVTKRFQQLPEPLSTISLTQLKTLCSATDSHLIITLPALFAQALKCLPQDLSSDFLLLLSCANVYGWIAYTIYDNFLDNEGNAYHLSTANVCLRELTCIFSHLFPLSSPFATFFNQTLDRLDAANLIEVKQCRIPLTLPLSQVTIPSYQNVSAVAFRSLGHALGPAAIMIASGYPPATFPFKTLWSFFTHTLAARQLNDDAHDWEDDCKHGFLTYVTTKLLTHPQIDPSQTIASLLKSDTLPNLYWTQIIKPLSQIILSEITLAKQDLQQLKPYLHINLLTPLLQTSYQATQAALKDQRRALAYIRTFSSNKP